MTAKLILSKEGYWSNDQGWVTTPGEATRFTEDQAKVFNLPIGDEVRWEDSPDLIDPALFYDVREAVNELEGLNRDQQLWDEDAEAFRQLALALTGLVYGTANAATITLLLRGPK